MCMFECWRCECLTAVARDRLMIHDRHLYHLTAHILPLQRRHGKGPLQSLSDLLRSGRTQSSKSLETSMMSGLKTSPKVPSCTQYSLLKTRLLGRNCMCVQNVIGFNSARIA